VSWPFIALLVLALVVLAGAEWQRLAGGARLGRPSLGRMGPEARNARARQKRKSNLKLIRSESEEFAESVQRDLADLPTIEEKDRRR